jgi:putative ABC transport system permease protein
VTKRTFTGGAKGALLRKVLVAGQFTAALVVISASFIVYRQLAFLRTQDLGLRTDQVLIVSAASGDQEATLRKEAAAFRNSVEQLPQVEKVSVCGSVPGIDLSMLSTSTGISRYGSKTGAGYNYYLYSIDAGFIPAMQIKMAAGHNFDPGKDNSSAVIVNREAARLLGFSSPESAVGGRIFFFPNEKTPYSTIIGVMEDYHQQSMKGALLPMIHWYQEIGNFYAVKIKTTDMPATLAQIRRIWEQQHPGYPFDYRFLDQLYDQQFRGDERFGKVVKVFSVFTLFITCLGILGLTAFSITRRRKEIGIRKTLGASVVHIVTLLSRDFVYLVLIALAVATPLTWWAMSQWLDNFAYRAPVSWTAFSMSGLLTLLVAMATISVQTLRAALDNPVHALRSE